MKGANLGYPYSLCISYEQWGAGWSYESSFPNHLIVGAIFGLIMFDVNWEIHIEVLGGAGKKGVRYFF